MNNNTPNSEKQNKTAKQIADSVYPPSSGEFTKRLNQLLLNDINNLIETLTAPQPEAATREGKWIGVHELKDSVRVQLTDGVYVFNGSKFREYWNLESDYQDCIPTHFKPLPTPPKQ